MHVGNDTSFEVPVAEIMQQRVHTRRRNVWLVDQVLTGTEARGRIAEFSPAVDKVMFNRFDTGFFYIRIFFEVIVCVKHRACCEQRG